MNKPPNPDELNPQHPVTQEVHDHWHKLAALLMVKLNADVVVITPADIERMNQRDLVIIAHAHADCLEIKLLPRAEGERLAREAGGI